MTTDSMLVSLEVAHGGVGSQGVALRRLGLGLAVDHPMFFAHHASAYLNKQIPLVGAGVGAVHIVQQGAAGATQLAAEPVGKHALRVARKQSRAES